MIFYLLANTNNYWEYSMVAQLRQHCWVWLWYCRCSERTGNC